MKQENEKVYRAGMIPYYIDEQGQVVMMFMKPSDVDYGGDRWQIAKGKVDPTDASAKEAAVREAKEELGLFIGNVLWLEELGNFLGRTTFFICKIKNKDMFGEPHFETKEIKWMTPKEFYEIGRELHKPVVKAAERLIEKIETRQSNQQ